MPDAVVRTMPDTHGRRKAPSTLCCPQRFALAASANLTDPATHALNGFGHASRLSDGAPRQGMDPRQKNESGG